MLTDNHIIATVLVLVIFLLALFCFKLWWDKRVIDQRLDSLLVKIQHERKERGEYEKENNDYRLGLQTQIRALEEERKDLHRQIDRLRPKIHYPMDSPAAINPNSKIVQRWCDEFLKPEPRPRPVPSRAMQELIRRAYVDRLISDKDRRAILFWLKTQPTLLNKDEVR